MHRFYVSPDGWNSGPLTLSPDESHHCLDVLRLGEGDRVVAFDGRGTEATARVAGTARGAVTLEPLAASKSQPVGTRITLGQAVPKGKNMDLIVQKATELGAAEIVPLLSERSVVALGEAEAARKREKWQRVAVEACKQSGQNWTPEIAAPVTPERFFATPPVQDLLLVASLGDDSRALKAILAEHTELKPGAPPRSALVLVGPEGDFTPSEINLAKAAGCLPVSLGPIVLRTETAALYCLSVLAHELF